VLSDQRWELLGWWLRRMAAVQEPVHEKLTFLWHNHFATSLDKVKFAPIMAAQNQTLRKLSRGDFRSLAYAMLTDAAMLMWLDGYRSTAVAPNENLSREFMELFTLGHGNGYTEGDVKEGARALTGWVVTGDGRVGMDPRGHDTTTKTVLGSTADFDAYGFCDVVLAQRQSADFVAGRLCQQLASDTPPSASTLQRLVTAYGPGRDLKALTQAILTDPPPARVSTPVEWQMGVIRSLKVSIEDRERWKMANDTLDSLGQQPFCPPDVGGWPWGRGWLTTCDGDRYVQLLELAARAPSPR
jgi:uncharacterized protein (DUF1800 family)